MLLLVWRILSASIFLLCLNSISLLSFLLFSVCLFFFPFPVSWLYTFFLFFPFFPVNTHFLCLFLLPCLPLSLPHSPSSIFLFSHSLFLSKLLSRHDSHLENFLPKTFRALNYSDGHCLTLYVSASPSNFFPFWCLELLASPFILLVFVLNTYHSSLFFLFDSLQVSLNLSWYILSKCKAKHELKNMHAAVKGRWIQIYR